MIPAGGQVVVAPSPACRTCEPSQHRSGEDFERDLRRSASPRRTHFTHEHFRRRARRGSDSIARQAYAGLLWSKQFYHYVVSTWLEGDPLQPPPPGSRMARPQCDWPHLFSRDVLSMPDKWEYPVVRRVGSGVSHDHLRQHRSRRSPRINCCCCCANGTCTPTGSCRRMNLPSRDVNPPVHAWACWRVYKMTGPRGQRDRLFLERSLPEAADQLHLVGQPQGHRRQTHFRRRISGAR